MTWTTDPPTESGLYWAIETVVDPLDWLSEPVLVSVREDGWMMVWPRERVGDAAEPEDFLAWKGPIRTPRRPSRTFLGGGPR